MQTGFLCHELYFWHFAGKAAIYQPTGGMIEPDEHVESPESKRRFRNLLEVSGLLDQLKVLRPAPASESDVLLFHTREHLELVKRVSEAGGGEVGDNATLGNDGYRIAMLSLGGAIDCTTAVLRGDVCNAYALVRPPGHHAEADRGRGFCVFGNLAIAAMKARAEQGVGRIMTLDWDVHHGNGTQKAFYASPDVLTISVHQHGLFPRDSGELSETGQGAGDGYNINVPLPPGCGHDAYLTVIDRVVRPAAERFKPELILVSCGFDSSAFDPLGRMMCNSSTYREMTSQVMALADAFCDGRLVMFHEGGYNPAYVPFCGLAVMEQMSGISTGQEDPFLAALANHKGHDLQPHQQAVINAAAELVGRID